MLRNGYGESSGGLILRDPLPTLALRNCPGRKEDNGGHLMLVLNSWIPRLKLLFGPLTAEPSSVLLVPMATLCQHLLPPPAPPAVRLVATSSTRQKPKQIPAAGTGALRWPDSPQCSPHHLQ